MGLGIHLARLAQNTLGDGAARSQIHGAHGQLLTCYHPQRASQLREGERLRFNPPHDETNLVIPCGKCIGCRVAHAAQWGNRCQHEASLYKHNRFVTLTYDQEHLPPNGFLQKRDVQLWLKRLRKEKEPQRVRFFLAGKYGEHTGRAHYHALLFNCRWDDEKVCGKQGEHTLYSSEQASETWGNGEVRIGKVTGASAAYVAQYTVKGSKQPMASHDGVPPTKPFLLMSRMPGIGMTWLEQYADDLKHGYLIIDGRKQPIPSYYKRKVKTINPERHYALKWKAQDETLDKPAVDKNRLTAGEIIHRARRKLTAKTRL